MLESAESTNIVDELTRHPRDMVMELNLGMSADLDGPYIVVGPKHRVASLMGARRELNSQVV
ncbi:hypothetical protein ACLOJK_020281 [Asimina triloba]